MRRNLFRGTTSTPPSIPPTSVARAFLPSLPVAIAMRWITVARIAPLPLPWPPRKPPRSGNQIDHSPSGVVSALFLHFRAPQVRLKRESVSPGIKGNVPSPGRAHTNTSVHRVKPVTRPKTALLPPQTQPSSSQANRGPGLPPYAACRTALAAHVNCCFMMVLICLHACISAWVASLPIGRASARGHHWPTTHAWYAGFR